MNKTPTLYGEAARSYHARVPYLPSFFSALAQRLLPGRSASLLDVAAGPGPVAVGLSSYVNRILLVDSDAAMLTEARRQCYASGCEVEFLHVRFERLPEESGLFDLATIGRALHWLPRDAALAKLASHVRPGGHVAVCEAGVAGGPNNPWFPAFQAIRREARRSPPPPLPNSVPTFFAGTPFVQIGEITRRGERMTPIDHLVERLFSYSGADRTTLGAKAAPMADALRSALAPYATEQMVQEIIYSTAVLLRRK